jgi:hypothetical protein
MTETEEQDDDVIAPGASRIISPGAEQMRRHRERCPASGSSCTGPKSALCRARSPPRYGMGSPTLTWDSLTRHDGDLSGRLARSADEPVRGDPLACQLEMAWFAWVWTL